MKKNKLFLLLSFILMPVIVFASSSSDIDFFTTIFMEAFISIHMSVFVLNPLSQIVSPANSKKLFWTLFFIRVGVLLFFDLFITTNIAIFDFLAVFVGAFVLIPALSISKSKKFENSTTTITTSNIGGTTRTTTTITTNSFQIPSTTDNVIFKCEKCGGIISPTSNFCTHCGSKIEKANQNITTEPKVYALPGDFDPIYNNSERQLLDIFINREMQKAGLTADKNLIPEQALKRKKVLSFILSILIFIYISLIFFHFPIYTYLIGLVILIIFFFLTSRFNLVKYLRKEIKSRPNEKISNIVMNTKNSLVIDTNKKLKRVSILIAILLPLVIFMNPHIIYERTDGGYAVRFYTFGITNFTSATIPSTHNGEEVVSLRGNTFSNMPFLLTVSLPDTITEIRGQAFKNDYSLKNVNIPINLEYLGGGSFYNCKSITSIVLPDSLTYMGGETFYGASSLESVVLSNNLTEIRGNSFEYCTSLTSISIPDNVTRIGGHAFYGDKSLSEVTFTSNSKLNEIGSSAFRQCNKLYSITLPRGVSINTRAFKESPTRVYYFD